VIDPGKNPEKRNQLILLTIIFVCAGIVIVNFFLPLGFVIWILYLVPLLISVWLTGRYIPFIIIWLITGIILAGNMIFVSLHKESSDLSNLAVFILMIAIVALLVWEIRTNYTLLEVEVIERRKAQENLEDLNQCLEERITKRTRELSDANREFTEDIKKRRRVEAALGTANQKLSLLAQITQHDISNRVFALLAELDLAKDLSCDPKLTESLRNLERTAMAIHDQITFTKDYGEIGVQAPAWYPITPLIQSAADQLQSPDVTVTVNCNGVEVFADAMISKVFYNLIHNALRHGKHLTRVTFSYQVSGSDIVIFCEDNGTGIEPTEKDNIFRKGFGKDSGLGLFLSREILSITGITIQETGEWEKGARFKIQVPDGDWRITES
jgi:signal transduction histidine kinase